MMRTRNQLVLRVCLLLIAVYSTACTVSGETPTQLPPPTQPAQKPDLRACTADADCLVGYTCQNKVCSPCRKCLQAGEKRCTKGNQVQICEEQSNGCTAWRQDSTCTAGQLCSAGACVTLPTPPETCRDSCVEKDRRCVDGVPYRCEKKGKCTEWTRQNDCSGGEVCQAGQCQTPEPTKPPAPAPEIVKFKADYDLALPGERISIQWEVKGAAYIILKPNNATVVANANYYAYDKVTTTYTLEAYRGDTVVRKSFTIKRDEAPEWVFRTFEARYWPTHSEIEINVRLLSAQKLCPLMLETKRPDGSIQKDSLNVRGTSFEGRQSYFGLDKKNMQPGQYRFRIHAYTTKNPLDCASPIEKSYYYPAWDGTGQQPWSDPFEAKKEDPSQSSGAKCPTSCKTGDRKCTGSSYQVCVTDTPSRCPVWSQLQSCPQGNVCVLEGRGCLPSTTLPSPSQKEVKVAPGNLKYGASPVQKKDGVDIYMPYSFYIWKHEYTEGEYLLLTEGKTYSKLNPLFSPDKGKLPVQLNYDKVLEALNRLSAKYNLPPCYTCTGSIEKGNLSCKEYPQYKGLNISKCKGYRLPTLLEWEYAYRAGTSQDFYSGNMTRVDELTNTSLDAIGWYYSNSQRKRHPVGQKQPNAWGLYDMPGNVWEYVHHSDSGCRIKGGSFQNAPQHASAWAIDSGCYGAGFRPVRTAP